MEDSIEEIGIDDKNRLYLKPSSAAFPMIYREALEVHWNEELKYLYGAEPRKWNHFDWYQHILSAASIQGCRLRISPTVSWVNISSDLQAQILGEHRAKDT